MRFCRPERFLVLAAGILLCGIPAACARDSTQDEKNPPPATQPTPANQPALPVNTGWDEKSAGKFMIVSAADDGVSVAIILPNETDSTLAHSSASQVDAFANTAIDLFSPAGSAGTSTLAINSQPQSSEGCLVWPSARLMTKPASEWTVGFAAGHAKAIQIDSVEKLPSADSVSITTELAKQASAISVNGDAAFRGLPFIVQKAYRLSMGDTTALVGSIVRKINEEANPREEHLLLVVERPNSGEPYTVGYQNRSAGPEDAVRTSSLLAAVRFLATNRAALVISFEYDDGGQVTLLERVSSNNWKITWRSAYTGC